MCLALPARITTFLPNTKAIVNVGGIEKEISLDLLNEHELKIGDYVIIHVGYALTRLKEDEAIKTLRLFEEMVTLQNQSISK